LDVFDTVLYWLTIAVGSRLVYRKLIAAERPC